MHCVPHVCLSPLTILNPVAMGIMEKVNFLHVLINQTKLLPCFLHAKSSSNSNMPEKVSCFGRNAKRSFQRMHIYFIFQMSI